LSRSPRARGHAGFIYRLVGNTEPEIPASQSSLSDITFNEGCAMKLHKTKIRACSSIKTRMLLSPVLLSLPLLFCLELQPAIAQEPSTPVPVKNAPLTTQQVVGNLVRMNLGRAQALHAYQGTRIYRVDYHGFPNARSAEMIVDVKYRAPGTKDFTIVSATGSKIIIDMVFKKLLESEKEALSAEAQKRTALNSDNYDFTMVGYENTPSGLMYVLTVEPRTKDKFLYRGRVWVDAEDFAVVRLKAEPAKNPSFWTKNSEIEELYIKVSDFWLPARNHSISAIRLGGNAELTIEYDNYKITTADAVANLPVLEPTRPVDTSRVQRPGDHQ
jgi:hypothetical protein